MQVTERRTDRHLLGYRALEQEQEIDRLAVEGELPAWLAGSLLRTGPANGDLGQQRVAHWFDGLAMLHRFSFSGGEGQLRQSLPSGAGPSGRQRRRGALATWSLRPTRAGRCFAASQHCSSRPRSQTTGL